MPKRTIYLDNAATSFPKPPGVRAAILDYHDRIGASAGRGAYAEAREAGALLDGCREGLARLLGAPDPTRLIFTLNCTDALNLGLKGVLRPGDHVVTTWMDHNSILRPLAALEQRGLVTVTRVRADADGVTSPEALRAAIGPRTRLVATLHASNVSGGLQDVTAIARVCRETGVLFLLDAAQTAGSIPIRLETLGADLVAFPGHKGLMGPLGTGVLWIGPGVEPSTFREGGTGSRSEEAVQPGFLPDRHEAGSHNLLGIAGLAAAVAYLDQAGMQAVAAHKRALSERFLERLSDLPGVSLVGPRDASRRVPVFSVVFDGLDPGRAASLLDRDHGVKVRSGLHCAPLAHRMLGTAPRGTLRLSAGWFTSLEDVDRGLDAVRDVARAARQANAAGARD